MGAQGVAGCDSVVGKLALSPQLVDHICLDFPSMSCVQVYPICHSDYK